MPRPPRIPTSTYRLQVHGGFTLNDARAVVPYLARLGAGAVYTSPYFAAEPGSTHGYDVTNHNAINPEVGGDPAHTAFADADLVRINGAAGQPRSFDELHELLETQAYRLAYWRTASHEINYRRFFDVNTLAGLRVEDPAVFDAIHVRLARLVAEGRVTGIRIDHPDGLFDPAKYCTMLQELAGHVYVVAEKILSGRERLPRRWPVQGTTGYN